MSDDQLLAQIVENLIERRSEGVYWDFKEKHHSSDARGDLVHDVLCLANADHDGPRFLVFGVRDSDYSVCSIDASEEKKDSGGHRGTLSRYCRQVLPVEIFRHSIFKRSKSTEGMSMVLVIEDEPKKPYYLAESYRNVKAHHIYTRVCDTNTPITHAAQPHEIERMWRERFGLDARALARAKMCLGDSDRWSERDEDGFVFCHHDVLPEFTLRAADVHESMGYTQEWTRGEVRTDSNYAGCYELRYHQTILKTIHYVGFDDRKKNMVAPDWSPVGQREVLLLRSRQYRVRGPTILDCAARSGRTQED